MINLHKYKVSKYFYLHINSTEIYVSHVKNAQKPGRNRREQHTQCNLGYSRNYRGNSGELWSKMSQTFASRIKTSNLVEMFVLVYLLGKTLAPGENPPLAHFGGIKMGRNISNIFNLSLSELI